MSKNIVFEGWLTKSPPSKRIWRTKWRRRWFALRQSGELPGQYFLDYYADRNYRRLKGTINLDLCEQVDAGLQMDRTSNGSLDPKLRGSVFTIQTQTRTYHLEADCEKEMERWVDAICRVCGLRATDDSEGIGTFHSTNTHSLVSTDIQTDNHETGPYIPISECITGVRVQENTQRFTFDHDDIMTSHRRRHLEPFDPPKLPAMAKPNLDDVAEQAEVSHDTSHADNRNDDTDDSSDEDARSLGASQLNIRECIAKVTKVTLDPVDTEFNAKGKRVDYGNICLPLFIPSWFGDALPPAGPPVPPRPPKTIALKEKFSKVAIPEPSLQEVVEVNEPQTSTKKRQGRRMIQAQAAENPSHYQDKVSVVVKSSADEEEECASKQPSLQYCNLSTLPPAVDRNLKPRPTSHNMGAVNISGQKKSSSVRYETKSETLQYLDLDLASKTSPAVSPARRQPADVIHGRPQSPEDDDDSYKTVDFVKTKAFNITRQVAELSRSGHH